MSSSRETATVNGPMRGMAQEWLENGEGARGDPQECSAESESSYSDASSSEDTLSTAEVLDDLQWEPRTGSPVDAALVDFDTCPGVPMRGTSREHTTESTWKRPEKKTPWSCYRAMGQGGRALALAGVTLATMLGVMKISGVALSSAAVEAVQTKPVDYNSLLGQLHWWCYHGHKWRAISHDFEKAGLLCCHQLLALADLQARPLTGGETPSPVIPSPGPAPAPEPETPLSGPYPCDETDNYVEVGIGDCYATVDTSEPTLDPTDTHPARLPETYQECQQVCDQRQMYFSIVAGNHMCCGWNFHTITKECILYTENPNSLANHEQTTSCCASTIHGL